MSDQRKILSESEELFLSYLEESASIKSAALKAGLSVDTGYAYSRKLKEVIIDRAREKLAIGTLKASQTIINSLSADASTEKGELKLKAAESILDRTGLTKHTSVEVSIENENGIFILPAKAEVPKDTDDQVE